MFDRNLCCRQLRYSGMMETIRIRRAGYPIRHNFEDFVDRYRLLAVGILPSQKENCRVASTKILQTVLKDADYQLGKTKVFLKVSMAYHNLLGKFGLNLQHSWFEFSHFCFAF